MMKPFTRLLCAVLLLTGAHQGWAQQVVIGNTSGSSSYLYGPIYRSSAASTFDYSRYAYVYTATELGIPAGALITNIEWLKANSNTLTGNNTFEIFLDNTSTPTLATGTTWSSLTATATSVYSSTTQDFTGAADTWESYAVSPFVYTGDNLLVLTDHEKNGTASGALNYYYTAATGKAIGYASGTAPSGSTTLSTGSYGNNRPTIRITYVPGTACSGMPATGVASGSVGNACAAVPFTISITGIVPESGITYQLQSSAPGAGAFVNVGSPQLNSSFSVTQSTATDYRIIVKCTNTGDSSITNVLAIGQNNPLDCYCTPSTTGATSKYISNFSITGGTTNINNTSGGSTTGYEDFHTTVSGSAVQGATLDYSITVTTGTSGRAIWIDFNEDGQFQSNEQVVSSTAYASSPLTGNFEIPMTATPGIKRMRILASNVPNNPSDPCGITSTGEYEDYAFEVIALTTCTGTPTPGTASASIPDICVSGTTVLSLSGYTNNVGGVTIQWEESANPTGPFTPVTTGAGGTTDEFTTGTITTTTYYRAAVTCSGSGLTDYSNVLTILVNNPTLTGITPGSRCGVGTVALSATASGGGTVNWYDQATGGTPIFTGNSFTTPVISTTTTFYAAASAGGFTGTVGKSAPYVSDGTNTGNSYLKFDAFSAFTLNSVVVYPYGTTSGPGTLTIALQDASGTTLQSATVNVTAHNTAVAETVPLNFAVAPGTNYRLALTGKTGAVTALYRDYSTSAGIAFPYTLPGTVSITDGSLAGYYYYFYEWTVSTGCEGVRTPVVATVSTPAALAITDSQTVCNGAAAMLSVTTGASDYDTYSWTPTTGLFTDAGGNTPYTGGNQSTVYAISTTAGTTTYALTASNSTTSCANTDTTTVTVLPDSISIDATPATICGSGTSTLEVDPATGYTGATLQWQESVDGITFTDISGATGTSYTTGTLSSAMYYRIQIRNSAGAVCSEPQVQVNVENPQLLTTTPADRCGPGTVTLNATANPGSTINWYDQATGGALLATGGTFTTPSISTTTTYYVAAGGAGSSVISAGRPTPQPTSTGFSGSDYGLVFDATQAFTLSSVDVYPTSTAGSMTVALQSSTGTTLQTATFAIPAGTGNTYGNGATPFTLNLNFPVPVGTGYRLKTTAQTASVVRDNPISGFSYPLPIGSVGQITSGWLGGSANSNTYYFFFNWQVGVGCEGTRTAVVATVNPTPVVNLGMDTAFCSGTALTLDAGNPGATYTWSTGATTQTINVTTSGTYSVAANNGTCAGTDTITVTVDPAVVIDLGPDTTICANSALTLDAGNPGANYNWSTGQNSQTISVSAAGTYFVNAMNGTCSGTDSIVVTTIAAPVAGAVNVVGSMPSYTFSGIGTTGATGYLWLFGDGNSANTPSASHTYTSAGTYTVSYVVTNECGQTDTATTTVTISNSVGNVKGLSALVQVYPNPSSGLTVIEADGQLVKAVEVMDNLGRVVLHTQPNANKAVIDVKGLAKGIYTLRIHTNGGTNTAKLQVE